MLLCWRANKCNEVSLFKNNPSRTHKSYKNHSEATHFIRLFCNNILFSKLKAYIAFEAVTESNSIIYLQQCLPENSVVQQRFFQKLTSKEQHRGTKFGCSLLSVMLMSKILKLGCKDGWIHRGIGLYSRFILMFLF